MSTYSDASLHDKFFKLSMQNKKIAQDVIRGFLPGHLLGQINWDSLTLEPDSYIDKSYRSAFTDILYSAQMADRRMYFYVLVEHQSSPDKLMPFRLWHYMCRVWERCLRQDPLSKKTGLPMIYPITLHHGRQSPYPYSMDLFDLFGDKELAKEYLLHKPFQLVDLSTYTNEQLSNKGEASVMLLLQKHAFQRDILKSFEEMREGQVIARIRDIDNGAYLGMVLRYALETIDPELNIDAVEQLAEILPEDRGKIMSVADLLREQGLQQGIQRGAEDAKLDVALKMLQLGASLKFISDATGLSKVCLKNLIENKENI